jgi:hypothetical protein
MEERIVLISERFTVLTFVSEILFSLLAPLTWDHVYVPVLPELLTDFIYSPTPFIMGIHASSINPSLQECLKRVS